MGSLRIICFSAMWVDCALTRSPEQLKIGISTYFDIQYKHERDSSWAKNSYETAKKLSSLSRGLENHPTPIKYSFISFKVQGDIPFHFFYKKKRGNNSYLLASNRISLLFGVKMFSIKGGSEM